MFDSLFPSHWTTLRKLMWLKLKGASAAWETISGNPVSFTALSAPIRKLQIAFSPVQDLNGYDSPWPAGGGKQLIPLTIENLKAKNTSGTWTGNTYALNSLTFAVSTNPDGAVTEIAVNGTASATTIFQIDNALSLPAGNYTLSNAFYNNKAYVEIVGKGATATDASKAFSTTEGETLNCYIAIINAYAVDNLKFKPMVCLSTASSPASFAPYSNECPISGWDSLTVYHSGADTSNPQTISISLGSTVYSGWVDAVTGIGEVTHKSVDMGSLSWVDYLQENSAFYAPLSGAPNNTGEGNTPDVYCTIYAKTTAKSNAGWLAFTGNNAVSLGYDSARVYFRDTRFADVAAIGNSLDGVIFVYPLATPIPIQLTPQEVQSLAGDNVVWSTANGDLTVEYRSN